MEYEEWEKRNPSRGVENETRAILHKITRDVRELEMEDATKEEIILDAGKVTIGLFACIVIALGVMMPEYELGIFFGIALLLTLLTRSALAMVATVAFTVVYFVSILLTGYFFGLADVWNFLWKVNTISLVPAIVGSTFAFIAMGTGFTHGILKNTNYAGLCLIASALIISLADAAIAYFILEIVDWWIIFVTHLAIYTVALLIAWGIFYLPARGIREGIDRATG